MTVADPISWSTAEKVAKRIVGREPFSSSYLGASLGPDFEELTRQAEALVEQDTGLKAKGPARVCVTDRNGWVRANVAAFRRMLGPLTDRLGARMANSIMAPVSRNATGAQLGAVLGWMSWRVLGQYDLLLLEDERPEDQDIVYYVGPNILALEKRYAFPPREFRLWLALHECTHRAQFTGVPWLPGFFRTQVQEVLGAVDPDPKRLSAAVKRLREEARAGNNPIADGGVIALFASPEQQVALSRIYGLMALLEGHGEVTMARAGKGLTPSAERFHRVLHQRRTNQPSLARVMQRLLGMEAKMKQYSEGKSFVEDVEVSGGADLMHRVWTSSETLPTYDEIRDPDIWIKRMTVPVS